MQRGNVTKKRLRFHATVQKVSDYQRVTKQPVAASRRTVFLVDFCNSYFLVFVILNYNDTFVKEGIEKEAVGYFNLMEKCI